MESTLLEALKLMVVGMSTVFLVLLIIICGGKLLIKAVNRFAPEDEPVENKASNLKTAVSPSVAKAIEKAVAQLTGDQAQVIEIKKL